MWQGLRPKANPNLRKLELRRMNITSAVYGLGRKKKRRFQQLEQMETKYNEMVPEFKRLEKMVLKLQAKNKKAKMKLEKNKSKSQHLENELQEATRNIMAQRQKLETKEQQFLGGVKINGKSFPNLNTMEEYILSRDYVPDHQVSATSAIDLQNVDESVELGGNGTANFEPSLSYQHMGSGHDYSKNAAYAAVGPSSVTNPGVLSVPDSLWGNSVSDPANNPENSVKGKSCTHVFTFSDLFPSQNYVPDGQVTATSAIGLQNVDGFVQSRWNGTANFQPSKAYQQIGSGQDYSKNAYTSVGPLSVASHGQEYNITATAVANQSLSVVSDTPSTHNGVLAVPSSSSGGNPEMLCDPTNIPESYDCHSFGWSCC